jgi:Icc-related predicted phosphoesterase
MTNPKLKLLILSDIHCQFEKFSVEAMNVKQEKPDLILIAGDITTLTGRLDLPVQYQYLKDEERQKTQKWLGELSQYARVLFIEGNHDEGIKGDDGIKGIESTENREENREIEKNAVNITHKLLFFHSENIAILGMSLAVAYDYPSLAVSWNHTTANEVVEQAYYEQFGYADIVVSHCPPSGKLGKALAVPSGKEIDIGSEQLRQYIIKNKPKLVICDHRHHNEDKMEEMIGETRVINVATKFKYIDY